MWHASARSADEPTSWAVAGRALLGVGDANLGEWRELGPRGDTVHLRRRLSEVEAETFDLVVRDIRGTAEERARLSRLFVDAPYLAELV